MGATKQYPYTDYERYAALKGRALAHPARVKILSLLLKFPSSNTTLAKILQMDKSCIKQHLDKLKEAELITIAYFPHFYELSINSSRLGEIETMIHLDY